MLTAGSKTSNLPMWRGPAKPPPRRVHVGLVLVLVCLVCVWVSGGYREDPVQTVHVVFMNHLDVGYTDLVQAVLPVYVQGFFEQAMDVSEALRARGGDERMIYTTHPWLVYMYLNCQHLLILGQFNMTASCPTPTQVQRFTQAVAQGDIVWHAGAFNVQAEVASPELYEEFLAIAQRLDVHFTLPPKRVLSLRDVPGMTRSVVPLLHKHGVGFVSVGSNGGNAPPDVPDLFRWVDTATQTSVVGFWHKGGYPGNPPEGLTRDNCLSVAQAGVALCYAFKTDNTGPPSIDETLADFKQLREEFPNAVIKASTFDGFVEALAGVVAGLPTVEGEIGDTWVQGIMSDPRKMQEYRAVSRAFTDCVHVGHCHVGDPALEHFAWHLVKVPEHTWGLPSLDGFSEVWDNEGLHRLMGNGSLARYVQGWGEQRGFITAAVGSIPPAHPLAAYVAKHTRGLAPAVPDTEGMLRLTANGNGHYVTPEAQHGLVLNAHGALVGGHWGGNAITWATPARPMGSLVYTTMNQSDFDVVDRFYDYHWNPGFSKAGTRGLHVASASWLPGVTDVWASAPGGPLRVVVRLTLPDDLHVSWGAPEEFYVEYRAGEEPGHVHLDVQWFNKTSTHLPEHMTVQFYTPRDLGEWHVDKLGGWVSPEHVVANGSQHQHAVHTGVRASGAGPPLHVASLDAALVLPMTLSTYPHGSPIPAPLAPLVQEDVVGMAFNLYNNVWNTNYILFYPYLKEDAHMRFRFVLHP